MGFPGGARRRPRHLNLTPREEASLLRCSMNAGTRKAGALVVTGGLTVRLVALVFQGVLTGVRLRRGPVGGAA